MMKSARHRERGPALFAKRQGKYRTTQEEPMRAKIVIAGMALGLRTNLLAKGAMLGTVAASCNLAL